MNRVKVNKVWVAADIGSEVINPLNAMHQVQGSVHRRHGRRHGSRRRRSWPAARSRPTSTITGCVRMNQAPKEIEVHFLKTNNPPTGLGELALPPIIPAITNAIYAATGKRIRTIPIGKQGFSWA